ncbi:hypothetical protein B0T21DRAFT_70940 [Apiosordaria backusii]|uniref:F-box domain-containing protein n=1 Tax=Apiosordaria backusii TaxID=314023 RepID=A0AA40AEK1_9PEZI|nr:hypothetical protein B0T21DRAFT_70940 [Apiosordaria backusii]
MLSIVDLPAEILDKICEILDIICRALGSCHDLTSARATCRDLKAVADRYVFRHIKFCMHDDDFDVLRSIANDHRSLYVQSLRYNTRIFSEETPLTRRLEFFAERMAIFSNQVKIMTEDGDIAFWRDVIPKFPNLREIFVTSDRDRELNTDMCDWRISAYQHLNLEAKRSHHSRTARHLQAVFEGLRAAGGSLQRLASVQTGFLSLIHANSTSDVKGYELPSWPFPSTWAATDCLGAQLSTLTHFGILLRNEPPPNRAWDWKIHPNRAWDWNIDIPMKNARMTVVKDIIKSMTNLQSLTLGLKHERTDSIQWFIPEGQHWQHLHTLHLANLFFGYQTLLNFLLRHKKTLRTLVLNNCSLRELGVSGQRSWENFFPDLKAGFLPYSLNVTALGTLLADGDRFKGPLSTPVLQTFLRDPDAVQLGPLPRAGEGVYIYPRTLFQPYNILKTHSFFVERGLMPVCESWS